MADTTSEDSKPWDASQYEDALRHLARLQEQLDGLRATIPSLVAPLSRPIDSKATLFAETKEAALRSTSSVHTFRDNWNSDETQEILKKGKDSLQKDPDLKKAIEVPKWGWESEDDEEK